MEVATQKVADFRVVWLLRCWRVQVDHHGYEGPSESRENRKDTELNWNSSLWRVILSRLDS